MCKVVEMLDGKYRLRCEFCGWQSEPMSKQDALTTKRSPHVCEEIHHQVDEEPPTPAESA